jgi:hypothetical protein
MNDEWNDHFDAHLRAFDIVDYVLYMMAIIVFVFKSWPILIQLKSAPNLAVPDLFILGFVVTVFLRNYVVMHAIDNRHEGDDLQFVALNVGWRYRLERILRALIVFVVITTPKDVFDFISGPVTVISNNIQSIVSSFVPPIFYEAQKPPHPEISSFFSYYATLLLLLFLLFIAWDLTNVFSVASAIKNKRIVWGQKSEGSSGKSEPVFHEAVNTLMIYFNIADRVTRGGIKTVSFSGFFVHEEYGEARVRDAKLLRIYFNLRSVKSWERVFGLLVASSILFWVSSNCSLASATPLFFCAGIYFLLAFQNRDFLKQMRRVVFLYPILEYLGAIRPLVDGQLSTSAISVTNGSTRAD